MRISRGLVALLLLAGCGATSLTSATPADPPPAAAPAAWELALLPSHDACSIEAAHPDGAGWVVTVCGMRVRVEGTEVASAGDLTASPITAIARIEDAWVFLTRAGEVFRAASPLGTLAPVGDLGGSPLGRVLSRERRLAILDVNARLFVAGEIDVRRVESALPVVDATFASASLGLYVDAGGGVQVTHDGGAHFELITLPEDAGTASRVFSEDGVPHVVTSLGRCFAVTEEGSVRDTGRPPPPRAAPAALAAEIERRVLDAVDDADEIVSGMSDGGRIVVRRGDGLVVLPGGAALPPPGEACTDPRFRGEAIVIGCENGLYRTEGPGSSWERIGGVTRVRAFAIDPTSDSFAVLGACSAGDDGGVERGALCVGSPRGAHDEAVADLRGASFGWSEGLLVAGLERDHDEPAVVVIDPETGARAPLGTPEGVHPSLLREPAVDGTLLVTERGTHRLFVGSARSGTTEITPPALTREEIRSAGALDRAHLWIEDEALWLSSDGGGTWEIADAPWPLSAGTAAQCRGRSCFFGAGIWLPAGGSPFARVVVRGHTDGRDVADPSLPLARSALSCEVPHRWSGHPLPGVPGLPSARLLVANGWVSIDGPSADAWTAGRLAGRAGGIQGGAPFEVHLRAGDVEPMAEPTGERSPSRVTTRLLAVTPGVALLERQRDDDGPYPPVAIDLVALGAGFAPLRLPLPTELVTSWVARPRVREVLPLADGSIAVRVADGAHGEFLVDASADLVLVVGPDGSLRHRAFESGPVSSARALAVDRTGRVGIVTARLAGDLAFLPIDASAPLALARPPAWVTRVCGAGDPWDVELAGWLEESAPDPAFVTIDTGVDDDAVASPITRLSADGSACLRGATVVGEVRSAHDPVTDLDRAGLEVHIGDGGLAGTLVSPAGVLAVRCSVVAHGPDGRASPPRGSVALGRTSDGTLGVVLGYSGAHVPGLLRGDAWSLGATVTAAHGATDGERPRFVPGAAQPAASVQTDDGLTLWTASGVGGGDASAGPAALLVSTAQAEGRGRVTIRVGDDGARRALDTGARTPAGAAALRLVSGDIALGVVLCDDEAAHDEGGCSLDAFESVGAELRARGSFALSSRRSYDADDLSWTIASSGRRLLLAVAAEPTYRAVDAALARGAPRPLPHVVVLESVGANVRPVGPEIVASSPYAHTEVLAVTWGARPRVAFTDTVSYWDRGGYVRVVELRGRDWIDVAAPWPYLGRVAAAFVGGALVVVSTAGAEPIEPSAERRAYPQAARLDGGAWTPLSIGPVPIPPPLPVVPHVRA